MRDISKDIHNLALTRLSQLHSRILEVDLVLAVSLATGARGHGGEIGR